MRFALIGAVVSACLAAAQNQAAAILEVDHVFILTAPMAKEERAAIEAAGFTVGSHVAKHTGSGTASVGLLFANAYLELLWLDPSVSIDAAQAKEIVRMRQRAAWRSNGASPFGIGLRRTPTAPDKLPIEADEFRAPWLRPGTSILTVRDVPASPLLFIVPRYVALDAWVADARGKEPESFRHKTRVDRLTKVTVAGPYQPPPEAVTNIAEIQFRNATDHTLELTFDAGRQGKRVDLSPTLPLILAF
jgi:Glyoxalase-like domain